jgi:hypothetical protein
MDMLKEIGVGVGTWIATCIIVWAIAASKQAREWFARRPWAIALALSLIAVGVAIGYTQYAVGVLRQQLLSWAPPADAVRPGPLTAGPLTTNPLSTRDCPSGTYVTSLEPAGAHLGVELIDTIQVVCRPLNTR